VILQDREGRLECAKCEDERPVLRWRVSLNGRRVMAAAVKLREVAYPGFYAAAARSPQHLPKTQRRRYF